MGRPAAGGSEEVEEHEWDEPVGRKLKALTSSLIRSSIRLTPSLATKQPLAVTFHPGRLYSEGLEQLVDTGFRFELYSVLPRWAHEPDLAG